MILSRFYYVVLSVALAGALFLLYLATAVSNRNAERTTGKLLTAASNAVGFYLKDDARTRTAALIPLALDPAVSAGLAKSSISEDIKKVDSKLKDKVDAALRKFREDTKKDTPFDALWAIDIHGRVLANNNFDNGTHYPGYEMGGYSLVADAIHGWIRDDAWVIRGQIWRVVARPVEIVVGGAPVGAIVAGKVVDDSYAQAISKQTGAAVAFFAGGARVASGAPISFDKGTLEVTTTQIEKIGKDPNYKTKGRTRSMVLRDDGVYAIYARMPGEAWDLAAGYLVAHQQLIVKDPFEFQSLADDETKKKVPLWLLGLIVGAGSILGIGLTLAEHTRHMRRFRTALADLAKKSSSTDTLKPSTFGGGYKKLALLVNDALDKIAGQSGVERGPADLESVLGPLPAQPQMSAFNLPDDNAAPESLSSPPGESTAAFDGNDALDEERPLPVAASAKNGASLFSKQEEEEEAEDRDSEASASSPRAAAHPARRTTRTQREIEEDEATQWRRVYEEFVALKKELGEPVDRLSYEKFTGTLQRNKDALMARHVCDKVTFRVYEKQGKAALKASPIKL